MVPDDTHSFKTLAPGTVISHYRIVEKVGAGGMGVVYRAVDTRLRRTVALKFLPPHLLCDATAMERFEHEAQAASALNHPNITTIYEIDEEEGRCFIAMEFIDGKSIKQILRDKNLFIDEVLDIAIKVGEGLAGAHEKDVVHRDVKSDNIMLAADGRVKIMDFGLAKLRGATRLTRTATTVGTLQYMSPEQAQGKETDRRSDIFSFGVVLYEMITGRLPFTGDNEAAVIRSILSDTPEPLARYKAEVPDGLERIVEKALYKDREERYQHVDDMVADLKREKHVSERMDSAQIPAAPAPEKRERHLLRFVVPAAIVALAILLLFIFEPFRIEMGPDTVAEAQESSLAVMYFENVVDPADTDKTARMITSLLIADLSESPQMYVISRQRLFDILSSLGKEDLETIDRGVASEVAQRAQAKLILTGEILQVEPSLVVTSDISEAVTGRIIATQRVAGEDGDDIFAVAAKLGEAVKSDMDLPEKPRGGPRPLSQEPTTRSREAFRYYTEGVDYIHKAYWSDAERCLRRAIAIDSTFATAYGALSFILVEPELTWALDKAMEYADHASPREKLYISALYARHAGDSNRALELLKEYVEKYPEADTGYYMIARIYKSDLANPEEAIAWARKLTGENPYHAQAYNFMAYAYEEMGDLPNAIWAINEYITLVPDEANPYDSRGDIYAYNGRLDEAMESYKTANTKKTGFSTRKIGMIHLYKREYRQAEACFRQVAEGEDRELRSLGRWYLAALPLYQGKLKEGIAAAEDGIAADRMEQITPYYGFEKYRLLAAAHLAAGNADAAIEWARRGLEASRGVDSDHAFYLLPYLTALVEGGRLEETEDAAEPVLRDFEDSPDVLLWSQWMSLAVLGRGRGDLDTAIRHAEKAIQTADTPMYYLYDFLATCCIEAARPGRAVEALEYALGRFDELRLAIPTQAATGYYHLGIAYEMSGWNEKAIGQYETFLDLWKDADPGIPVVEDVRARLAGLKASS